CYQFTGAVADRFRVRVAATSGTLVPRMDIVRPSGTTLCGPTTAVELTCPVSVAGSHTIFVSDSAGNHTGDYAIALQRLNNPLGCTALGFGAAAATATIASAAEMRCFTFTGAVGDLVRVRDAGASAGTLVAQAELVDSSGTTACGATTSIQVDCQLTTAGTDTIVLDDHTGTGTGSFDIAIQRLSNPAGCAAVAFGAAPVT